MNAGNNPGGRHKQLLHLRVVNRFLDTFVPGFRFPLNPHARLGRQHDVKLGELPAGHDIRLADRDGILRVHIHLAPAKQLQLQVIHHRGQGRHRETPSTILVHHLGLVLEWHIVHSSLLRDQLVRRTVPLRPLGQFQLAVLKVDALQHRRGGEEINSATSLGFPFHPSLQRDSCAGNIPGLFNLQQPA